jgi:NAD-dependent deacetylase
VLPRMRHTSCHVVDETTEALRRIGTELADARFAIALTGAGISTESGLPDYRGANGLWRNKRFADLAHIELFRREPAEFWDFYAERLRTLHSARPNPAHLVLEELCAEGVLRGVVTQNVDGLHRRDRLGSKLAELHGSLRVGTCLACGRGRAMSDVEERLAASADGVPRCDCGFPIKPGVVLFGELLPEREWATATALAEQADYALCLGSSLEVMPAGALPGIVLDNGGRLAIVNLGPTGYDGIAGVTKVEAPLAQAMPIVRDAALGLPSRAEHV